MPPNLQEVNVTVLTLAQQYCMEFRYIKLSPGQQLANNKIKTMCILFQVSSTIVYKIPGVAPDGHKILYAIDMQKTPIACIPDYTIDTTTVLEVQTYTGVPPSQTVTDRALSGAFEVAHYYNNIADAQGAAQAGGGKLGKKQASTASDKARGKAESERIVAALTTEAEAAAAQAEAEALALKADTAIMGVQVNLRSVLTSKRTIFLTHKRVASWGAFLAGKMMEYLFSQYFQLPTLFKQFAHYLQVCHTYYTTALIYNYSTARPYVFFNIPAGYTFTNLFVNHFTVSGLNFTPPAVQVERPQAYILRRLTEHTAGIKEIARLVTAPFMDEGDGPGRPGDGPGSPSSVSSTSSSMSSENITLFLLGCPFEPSQSEDGSFRPPASSESFSQSIESTSSQLSEWSESVSRSPLSRSLSLSPPRGEQPPGASGALMGSVKTTFVAPSPFNSSEFGFTSTSVPPPKGMEEGSGGNFTLKNHIKKYRPNIKSNNRKTTRKNGKFKRMIKKHTTKYKTYKRKANGRKLRGNKHKNNKTMRRYRCVRK